MAVRKAAFEDVGGLDEGMSDVHVCGIVGEDVGGLDEGLSGMRLCSIIIVGEGGHGVTHCMCARAALFVLLPLFVLPPLLFLLLVFLPPPCFSFVLLPPLHFPLLLVHSGDWELITRMWVAGWQVRAREGGGSSWGRDRVAGWQVRAREGRVG